MSTLKQRLDRVQNKAKENILSYYLKGNKRCHVQMPTGTGKTNLAFKVIKEMEPLRTLWLTQTDELIEQTYSRLTQEFKNRTIGLIRQDVFQVHADITVASVQTLTLGKNLSTLNSDFYDLIIIDEAHHGWADSWLRIIEKFNSNLLGLTATPYRMDALSLDIIMGDLVFELSYDEAVDKRLIAKDDSLVIVTSSLLRGVSIKGRDFSPGDLERVVSSDERNLSVVASYKKYGRKKMREHKLRYKTVCFCVNVDHAVRLSSYFNEAGVTSEILCAKENIQTRYSRKEVWDTFQNSFEIEVLCVVNILNEGKLIPDLACVLLTRPTQSAIVYPQQIGRGARFVEGYKSRFVVLDYVDNISKDFYQLNIFKFKGVAPEKDQVILEYYLGEDITYSPEEIIESLFKNVYSYVEKFTWDKLKVEVVLEKWIKDKSDITSKDLTNKNGLPSRKVINTYYGSFKAMREVFGLVTRCRSEYRSAKKDDISKVLLSFYKTKGDLKYVDLGKKNNLPSIRKVRSIYGSFEKCKKDLGIYTHAWGKVNIKKVVLEFTELNDLETLKHTYFYSTLRPKSFSLPKLGLPSYHTLVSNYGSWLNFLKELGFKDTRCEFIANRGNSSFLERKNFVSKHYPVNTPIKEESLLGMYAGRFDKKYDFAKKEIDKLIAEKVLVLKNSKYYILQ